MAEEAIIFGSNAKGLLRGFVKRVEALDEQRDVINDDIKEVLAEAKAHGFNPKAIRRIVADAKQDQDKRADYEAVLELYRDALGRKSNSGDLNAKRAAIVKQTDERAAHKGDKAH